MKTATNRFTQVYPRILSFSMAIAGIAIAIASLSNIFPDSPGIFDLNLFLICLVTSIPLGLLFCSIGRVALDKVALRSLFFIRPSSYVEETVARDFETYTSEIKRILENEGFICHETNETDDEFSAKIEKEKSSQSISFSDHKFYGNIFIKRVENGRSKVLSDLVFDDLALIETGETKSLENFHRHILCLENKGFTKDLPFTLLCGLCLTVISLLSLIPISSLISVKDFLVSLGFASLGMITFGIYHITKNPRESHGYDVGIIGTLLSLLIIIAGWT